MANYITQTQLRQYTEVLKTKFAFKGDIDFIIVARYSDLLSITENLPIIAYVLTDDSSYKKGFYLVGADGSISGIASGGGSGDGGTITITPNVAVGAIKAGVPQVNKTSLELWQAALLEELAPAVTITSSLDKTKVYEKGVPQTVTLTIKAQKRPNGGSDMKQITYASTPNIPSFTAGTLSNVGSYSDSKTLTFQDTQTLPV